MLKGPQLVPQQPRSAQSHIINVIIMFCWNNCKSFNDPTRQELFLKGDSSIFSRGTWRKVRKSLIRLWACARMSPVVRCVHIYCMWDLVSVSVSAFSWSNLRLRWYQTNYRGLICAIKLKWSFNFSDYLLFFVNTLCTDSARRPRPKPWDFYQSVVLADSHGSYISSPSQWDLLAYLTNTVLNTMRRRSH